MEENRIPKLENTVRDEQEKFLVTSVILEENNKEYFLYSDGKLYEKDNEGNLVRVDNDTPESKKIVEKIMGNFKPGKTDVVQNENNSHKKNKTREIDVDYPEL